MLAATWTFLSMDFKYWLIFGGALVVALLVTPLIRILAWKLDAVSHPVERSVHSKPTPHLGGLAIFAAFATVIMLAFGWHDAAIRGILLGGLIIVVTGVIDDFVVLSPWLKVLGQVLAATALIANGVRIDFLSNPFGGYIYFPFWIAAVFTVVWVVSITNAINLIDGLDGLAAGISSIAAVTMLVAANGMPVLPGYTALAVGLTAALAGSSLGFLPYNFNPAKIFMGDAGSMFLGYALAAVALQGALKSTAAISIAVPVLALGLPICDTLFAIIRRRQSGVPISSPDKDHLHHRLLRLGLSHRDTVLVMYAISGWLGISAIALTQLAVLPALVLIGFIAATLYYAARMIGVVDSQQQMTM